MLFVSEQMFQAWYYVVEPPKLYGPRAPIIVLKTSDSYTRDLDNFDSLSNVLWEPKSSTFYKSYRINNGVTTTLQHLVQK